MIFRPSGFCLSPILNYLETAYIIKKGTRVTRLYTGPLIYSSNQIIGFYVFKLTDPAGTV